MKIENQCCTLEQAKKLKEFGIISNALFYWRSDNKIHPVTEGLYGYAAFTAAELIKMNGGNGGIETGATRENKGKFYMQTDGFGEGNKPVFTYYNSFAEASAAKLIHALENEWLDVQTCNSRLIE